MAMLVCIGEPMLELNAQPPGPDGRTLFLEGPGGDVSNAAIAAARQGASVAMLTALGNDPAGDAFMALWSEEGIDTGGVVRDPDAPTATYIVRHGPQADGAQAECAQAERAQAERAQGHSFQYYRANSAASRFGPAQLDQGRIGAGRILYASGISQAISTSAADAVFQAIALARASGVAVAYDTNYRPRLWPALRAAAIIHAAIAQSHIALPGLEDAAALTGLTDPDAVLDFYLRLGPRLVVLKMGAAGAILASPEDRVRIPAFPCTPVDATGAGDTFCGAFLARILADDAPLAAATYAACAAALSTSGYGAVAPIPRAEAVWATLGARSPRAASPEA